MAALKSLSSFRWYAVPAATAFLNRENEFDSRMLFDKFIEKIERKIHPFPFLTYWHQGNNSKLINTLPEELRQKHQFRLGEADYIERVGKSLVLSGIWYDNPISNIFRESLEKSDILWGTSIKYWGTAKEKTSISPSDYQQFTQRSTQQMYTMYTDGWLEEVSFLPEYSAAGIKTYFVTKKTISYVK